MALWSAVLSLTLRRRKPQGCLTRPRWGLISLPLPLLVAVLMVLMVTVTLVVVSTHQSIIEQRHETLTTELPESAEIRRNETTFFQFQVQGRAGERNQFSRAGPVAPQQTKTSGAVLDSSLESGGGPYHNWELFAADYQEMLHSFKLFVYPDVYMNKHSSSSSSSSTPFARIFLPHPNPFDPKLGNYFSEHAFKAALLRSSLVTPHPQEAHFFFMPFSINAMRNDPRLHSASSIKDFVAQYTTRISSQFEFWNASGGADHFYVCCHSIGRDAASKHHQLHNNAVQVTCSSSYFQRLYIAHKDVGLPQVWPRQHKQVLNPPDTRCGLSYLTDSSPAH
ncbi:unnamed protein product [Ilex paraguariensis]|uniref:Exostosin GT47 domain-containing protein n=1 Tax=Ilex paraguariensis TaxID=185542 RepID=A0ABC8T6N2_9AQUA